MLTVYVACQEAVQQIVKSITLILNSNMTHNNGGDKEDRDYWRYWRPVQICSRYYTFFHGHMASWK